MRSLKARINHISTGEIMLLQMPLGFSFDFMASIVFIIIILVAIVAILLSAFWVWMLIDCAKRDFKDKIVWILIIVFTHFLGAILYYYIVKKPEENKKQEVYKKI